MDTNRHNWTEKNAGSHILKCTKCEKEVFKKSSYWNSEMSQTECILVNNIKETNNFQPA